MSDSDKNNRTISDDEDVTDTKPAPKGRFTKGVSEKKSRSSAQNAKKMAPARKNKKEIQQELDSNTDSYKLDYLKNIDNMMQEDALNQPSYHNDVLKMHFENLNRRFDELKNINSSYEKKIEYLYKRNKNKDKAKNINVPQVALPETKSSPKKETKPKKEVSQPIVQQAIPSQVLTMQELMGSYKNRILKK